jgi:hypothetical protein
VHRLSFKVSKTGKLDIKIVEPKTRFAHWRLSTLNAIGILRHALIRFPIREHKLSTLAHPSTDGTPAAAIE